MMYTKSILIFVLILLAFGTISNNAEAACNPVGVWAGILNSDTQPGGTLTNWTFDVGGSTSGEWVMFTLDGGTASSSDASGTWMCFGGQLLATYSGTATESTGGSQSGYTLEFSGTTTGDIASGDYTITFDNALWEADSGTWNLTRDAISNHVFCIEIFNGWDYEAPSIPDDLTYEAEVCIATDDTVELVEFQTPTGVTLQIPKLPIQWDEVNKVWTEYYFDSQENCYWWVYSRDLPTPADLADYDGTYTITVYYSDGSEHQTTAWFGIPNMTDPIPQPTQEPVFNVPQPNQSINSPVTFEWQQCTDPAVPDSNGILICLMREGTYEETEELFDKSRTSWGPIELAQGYWEAEFDFEQYYEYVNDDGIEVDVGKYSENDYEFAVDIPWTIYDVFGGDIDHTVGQNWWEYYYNIDQQQDYQKLDRTVAQPGQTATFFDNQKYKYNYYVIAAREELLIDSIRGQWDSYYYGNYSSGNTSEWGNITGPPDGLYATVGLCPTGGTYSGFVVISNQWNCSALTIITDIPGISVSGTVTDKATSLPLANMRVACWHEETETWTEVRTEPNGFYELTHLPPGWAQIRVEPDQGSGYAGIGEELNLNEDVNNLNFALPAAATLSGRVIDIETAAPLENIQLTYFCERYFVWRDDFTDSDGRFTLTNLPGGIAEIVVRPEVDTGYAWSLPWGANWVYLDDGEHKSARIIALRKGASVSGYIKYADGSPAVGIEYEYFGKMCEGWGDVDIDGRYEIILPPGRYAISEDMDEDFGDLPAEVTITDITQPVNVPDIIIYTEQTGTTISGTFHNPDGYDNQGGFAVAAMKAGTVVDPNTWHTIQPVSEAGVEGPGPFTIPTLPPGNYDVYLIVADETPDEIESITVLDSVLNVPAGTTGIALYFNSQGSTVTGRVVNSNAQPVMGAAVLFNNLATGAFGFSDTDNNGQYTVYNISAGIYTATAVHSKYENASTNVEVVDGIAADAGTIVMPFTGEKEGADLNGDGIIDIGDVAIFADQWLTDGVSESNFDQQGNVDLLDFSKLLENWKCEAIWAH